MTDLGAWSEEALEDRRLSPDSRAHICPVCLRDPVATPGPCRACCSAELRRRRVMGAVRDFTEGKRR